ncbi:MAG: hypothetical protein HC774_02210 [Sphingomonadales bacterium]|nr:hypothetical protein [Sphingomonadales bacterium]
MDIPHPVPGLVIRYAYLWADEHEAGQEEGSKDRPVAVVVGHGVEGNTVTAIVLPITHTPPTTADDALEIPAETKRRLGLDDQRSWIVLTETNVFTWPGPDIRPVPGREPLTIAYGLLPANFFHVIRDRLLAKQATRALRQVRRTE